MFFLQFCSSPQVMERVCDSLKNSTYVGAPSLVNA